MSKTHRLHSVLFVAALLCPIAKTDWSKEAKVYSFERHFLD